MVSYLKNLIGLPWIITFQINRGGPDSTVPERESTGLLDEDYSESSREHKPKRQELIRRTLETILIFLCFALFAGQLPPDVNESHYLTKAKHFWDPEWCAGDIFLSSSFAHWVFYVTTGWLAKLFSLSTVAWIGRVITWALLAFGWQRLSWNILKARGLSVLSAIFFLLLNDRFHLAGEWVVGGLEAKGFAYFFVLMGLGSMVSRDWKWAWPFLGAAAAFHVLVGGWAMIAACFTWIALCFADRADQSWIVTTWRKIKSQALPFCAGAALALLGLIPPLLADQTADPETSTAARLIYVNHRIAHHLTFEAFPSLHVARFLLICIFSFLVYCWIKSRWPSMFRRLRPVTFFCLGSLLISFGGLLLSGIAEQNDQLAAMCASLLRFYWFRLSDFAVPATTSLLSCLVISLWLKNDKRIATRISCFVFASCIVAAAGLSVAEKFEDPRPRADFRSLPKYEDNDKKTLDTYRNWRKVCKWISENTPESASFITPHEQQTFKWYAGRSEIVCWKDIPQDSHGIMEWKSRLNELYEPQRRFEAGLMIYSDEQLGIIAERYGATHLLIPQRQFDLAAEPTNLKQIYPVDRSTKSTYVVLEF